jgi:hypothetical protein
MMAEASKQATTQKTAIFISQKTVLQEYRLLNPGNLTYKNIGWMINIL